MVKRRGESRVFDIHEDLQMLTRFIEQKRAEGITIRVVIFDPLNAYFGGKAKGDSHKTADMRAILTPISEWADEMGVAVIGNSHFNKDGGKGAILLHRVVDSQSITAVARAVYYAIADQDGQLLFLHGKSNLHRKMDGLKYKIVDAVIP